MIVAGQPQVSYGYDTADRPISITQGSSAVAFTYDAARRRTSLTLPNGITTTYDYDAASQLAGLTYQLGDTKLGDLRYFYDLAGRRTNMTGSFARTGIPDALSSATYNANNQLTQLGGTSFTYDENGNLRSDGARTYTWDAKNQLASITGAVTASFQYDPVGRRVMKSVGWSGTSFLYDGRNIVQELSGSTPTANRLNAALDEVLTRTDAAGTSHYLTDALGSTLALTDAVASVQTQYSYDPFGQTTASGTSSSNPQRYTGRENDGTGLYFYRERYYNPTLQRFISEDPIGVVGGINLYEYVGNDPALFRLNPKRLNGQVAIVDG
jgi:RHS repeat-associated protein